MELKHDCYYLDRAGKMITDPVTLTDQDVALLYPGLTNQ